MALLGFYVLCQSNNTFYRRNHLVRHCRHQVDHLAICNSKRVLLYLSDVTECEHDTLLAVKKHILGRDFVKLQLSWVQKLCNIRLNFT